MIQLCEVAFFCLIFKKNFDNFTWMVQFTMSKMASLQKGQG